MWVLGAGRDLCLVGGYGNTRYMIAVNLLFVVFTLWSMEMRRLKTRVLMERGGKRTSLFMVSLIVPF